LRFPHATKYRHIMTLFPVILGNGAR